MAALRPWQHALVRLLAPAEERDDILADLEEDGPAAATWQVTRSVGPWCGRRAREAKTHIRRSVVMMHRGIGADVRLAARRLGQSPGFTVLAVVTLAVGIGAVSTVFGLAYALWLKPLPWHEPDRVVWLAARHTTTGASGSFTSRELAEYQRAGGAFGAVAGFHYGAGIARVNGEPVRIVSFAVTPNLFRVLGMAPAVGRDFNDQDVGASVVMLSHAMWTSRFAQDPAIAGKTLSMTGETYEIAGVMPRGFSFPRGLDADVWIPGALVNSDPGGQRRVQAVARLAPGRTLADASLQAASIARGLVDVSPATNADWTHVVTPADATASASSRLAYQALLAIVGLFLLIACANLAGLLLARNAGRRVEFAVCLALGAPRWRLVRLLLAESLVLATAGAAVGIVLSLSGGRLLASLLPRNTPGLDDVTVSVPVLAVTIGVACLAAILISVVPALGMRSLRPSAALAGTRGATRPSTRGQQVVVVAEVALAVMLLAGATAMTRSFFAVLDRDRGYDPNGLQAMNVSLPFSDDRYRETEWRAQAFDQILERAASVPGVRGAAATTGFPGSPLGILGAGPVTPEAGRAPVMVAIHAASAGYFDTMRVPLLRGRGFTRADTSTAPRVTLVNELLAAQFPDGNPVGHRIPLSIFGTQQDYEIVGVVGNILLTGSTSPRAFVPLTQVSAYWIDLVFRADSERAAIEVRQTLRTMNAELLLENDSSFASIIMNSVALERAQSAFAAVVGALATVVAGVGIYALLMFLIAQQRKELSIRLALGSQPGDLFRSTLGRALTLSTIGLVVGAGAVWLLVRYAGSRVFGLTSAGIESYLVAGAIVAAVSVVAAWLPARRAMTTDPLTAMRAD